METPTNPTESDFEEGFVLVVGSAGIDVKGRPLSEFVLGTSNLGHVRNSVGGVARNIAENLARLEVSTILLTAVGADAEGDRVVHESSNAGINCDYVRRVPGARTGNYMALLRENGELHIAITDFEVATFIDSDYLHQHEFLFSTAQMIVIDATLSEEALETLFELAEHYGVQVCADPTTPALAGKLRRYLSQLHLIVPNAAETAPLCGLPVPSEEKNGSDDAIQVAHELVRSGADIAVVTLGAKGLAYAHSGVSGFIRAANVEVVDPTGAGDAFSAAVIFGLLNEVAIDEAMRLGATAAALTLVTRETVSPDLSQERLYDELVV